MGQVWRWALQADKAGPDFNPQKPHMTYPVGSSQVDSYLSILIFASCDLWDWFHVLGPNDVQRRPGSRQSARCTIFYFPHSPECKACALGCEPGVP